MITVFTPTYNRAHLLRRLYDSLCEQTVLNSKSTLPFEWLIVDDGSQDDSKKIVESFISQQQTNNNFPIRYIKKENGGKHTAINWGAKEAQGEMFFIVDSDDILIPEALEIIAEEWKQVKNMNLCGISFLRGAYVNGKLESRKESEFRKDRFVGNFIDVKYNHGSSADNAEVWVTEYVRKYPFNVYPGERFMSEGMAWIRLAKERDMLFVNKIIYVCEYLEGGLTKQGKKLRFLCPLGGMEGSLETMSREFSVKIRIKETLLYIVYSKFAGYSVEQILKCPYRTLVILCLAPGITLYYYWKHKYFSNENK